jgi:Tol biopolymer transport system component/tRNA A-37 threonylcarbamoyl transferase component Bud32
MALESGTQLGVYRIVGPIGAGGMGEVYRATDTKLGRDVAIKTLRAALADDTDRLARFEREAKLLAALNHPHIAAVHNLDEHDGIVYLAMELVEGESLEAKLKSGALPVDDALLVALQIAEALEAAHGKGVVHRDLKPANVMLTPEGQVKVLDFGLAKAFAGNSTEASPMHSPALSVAMTQQGLVLGTAGYMSPEQASGQGTDQRGDVWAFGVVLFEMLTGLPLFKGESVPHVLADVLKTEPDWSRLPQNLHPRLRLLLERCLTKKPHSRLHSIADARIEIEAALADPSGPLPAITAASGEEKATNARRLAAAIAVTAVVAVGATWMLRPVPVVPEEDDPVLRFSIPVPSEHVFTNEENWMIAVSADGRRVAYIANRQIYLRNLNEAEARPVPGTLSTDSSVGATNPEFSPDGNWLAYVDIVSPAGPYLVKRVPVTGGASVLLHEGESGGFPFGLHWPVPDAIMFANSDGIVRMPAAGGALELLVAAGENERIYSPKLLPGGEAVLFTSATADPDQLTDYDGAQVVVQSIGGDDRTVIWEGGSAAQYLPSGHLLYAQGNALFALPFDLATRSVSGGPVAMLDGLRRSPALVSDAANYAVSDTGTLVQIPGNPNLVTDAGRVRTTLAWLDRDGNEEPLPVRADDYTMARVSPDGAKVALVVSAFGRDLAPSIWIFDLATSNLALLTTEPAVHDGPLWSGDGTRLYFRSPGETSFDINVIELASGEVSLVAEGGDGFPFPMPYALVPGEETLAIINARSGMEVDIATLSVAEGVFTRLLGGDGIQSEPSLSADGTWIAYHDTASRAPGPGGEINIRPYPAVARTRIPVGPGMAPVFSRDGTELFFVDGESIASVAVSYEPSLAIGPPRTIVSSSAYMWFRSGRTWDPDPSGERFIVIRDPATPNGAGDEAAEFSRIDVVVNWLDELNQRVPVP